jgi:uncharacterized protein (DUF1501 family)
MDKHSRRDFIARSASLIAVGLTAPTWLSRVARAEVERQAAGLAASAEKVLVVCQLSGGNDGLNTVIPYTNAAYYRLRPTLAIPEAQQLAFSSELAFHPALAPLRKLYEGGQLAIVNGVGYPNPNRSHFASMSVWQTADPGGREKHGWLGRYLDAQASSNPVLALSLGNGRTEALQGATASVPTFASLEDVRAMVGDADAQRTLRALQAGVSGEQSTVSHANDTAFNVMDALAEKLGDYTASGSYGGDAFGQGFRQIAQLIAVSPTTKVIYFSVGGFDTHANQAEEHSMLLSQLADASSKFMAEIDRIGRADKVSLLVFSEFGRRVMENGSLGTDHGAAAPVMLLGGGVNGGMYGAYPSLTDLADGDLRYSTDFRQVYATVLQDWLGSDSAQLLGSQYGTLPLFG